MFQGKSNTFTSDLLRNPIFLFGLLCLGFLGMKKLAAMLRFGPMGDQIATYDYQMVRGKDVKRMNTLDDYPTVFKENNWTPPTNRNPMSGAGVKNTVNGPAAAGQAAAPAKKGSIPGAAAAAKAQQAKRKPKMKVDVIGDDAAPAASSEAPSAGTSFNDVVYYGAPPVAVAAPAGESNAETDEKKLTLNEWRAIISTANRQNMDKLLTARRNGEISSADFYTLVKELVLSHADDRQKAGVYALQSDVSPAAFEFMVVNKSQAVEGVQTQLSALLKKYEEPAQADELAKVLGTSKRPEVVVLAMKSLTVAVAALKKQVSSQGEGGTRNPAVAAQAQRDLLALVPSLRRMSTSGDEVSGMAADLLGQIESLTQQSA